MSFLLRSFSRSLGFLGFVLLAVNMPIRSVAAEPPGEFRKGTIDVGIYVKDADKTARFLTNAIGFRELPGFSVPAAMGNKIGLVENQAFKVRTFALDSMDAATRIKVLSFPEVAGKPADQAFVHSQYGIRYFTLYVKSIDRALERLKAEGVALLGETPVDLGGTFLIAVRDPDGNFYELIGPRK